MPSATERFYAEYNFGGDTSNVPDRVRRFIKTFEGIPQMVDSNYIPGIQNIMAPQLVKAFIPEAVGYDASNNKMGIVFFFLENKSTAFMDGWVNEAFGPVYKIIPKKWTNITSLQDRTGQGRITPDDFTPFVDAYENVTASAKDAVDNALTAFPYIPYILLGVAAVWAYSTLKQASG